MLGSGVWARVARRAVFSSGTPRALEMCPIGLTAVVMSPGVKLRKRAGCDLQSAWPAGKSRGCQRTARCSLQLLQPRVPRPQTGFRIALAAHCSDDVRVAIYTLEAPSLEQASDEQERLFLYRFKIFLLGACRLQGCGLPGPSVEYVEF